MQNMTAKLADKTPNFNESQMTGSRFLGPCDLLGMQEFGTYVYPDGTKYSGEFLNNRFHGSGTIKMPHPEAVSFKVVHNHGRLVKIEGITFNDELPVEFDVKGYRGLSFSRWNYLSESDRRFHKETLMPMEAVGPNKFKCKDGPIVPTLPRNTFDLGFAHFNQRGFVLDANNLYKEIGSVAPAITDKSFYLGCRPVRRWIRESYRHGNLWNRHIKQEVHAHFARQIIQNNLESSGCTAEMVVAPPRICRRSASLDSVSSGPAQAARLHLASTSDSSVSELQEVRDRTGSRRRKEMKPAWKRSQSESFVCHIN
ncbi:hypothetical protein KR018_011245 [Drosophila ironensis]|nr:hypothetical protein KR018_011245 [Drosophila ironensis]